MLDRNKGGAAVIMKQLVIEVDADTFDSAFTSDTIILKQKDSPNELTFYSADQVWRDDEIIY